MIIYQVYPRSFYDSNNDGIGDLNGITEKIPYISSLGVDTIWISPFFKSPMKDFGYDVSDYRDVDPIFGNLDDFKELIEATKRHNLKVIIDHVISHTSEEHQWFKDSKERKNNKEDWYLWVDPKEDGTVPNNWVSVFGGTSWRWDADRRQYYYHTFLSSQPDLNMHNMDVQDQVLEDLRFWLDLGVSGFRFDALNHVFQDKELRNNPPSNNHENALHPYGYQYHEFDQGRPEMEPFLDRVGALLNEYNAYSLAEVGGDNSMQLMKDYTREGRLNSSYSFSLMRDESSAKYIQNVVESLEQYVTHPGVPCYAMSNHDKPRVASRWAHGRDPKEIAKFSIAMLMCLKGHICVYQGEELGLTEADIAFEDLQDPFGKNFWPKFKGRDGCRTPMPWTDKGGFIKNEPELWKPNHKAWLPIPNEHLSMNVKSQERDEDSVLNFFKKMVRIRKSHIELSYGRIFFEEAPDDILFFSRQLEWEHTVCIFNTGFEDHEVDVGIRESVVEQKIIYKDDCIVIQPGGFLIAYV